MARRRPDIPPDRRTSRFPLHTRHQPSVPGIRVDEVEIPVSVNIHSLDTRRARPAAEWIELKRTSQIDRRSERRHTSRCACARKDDDILAEAAIERGDNVHVSIPVDISQGYCCGAELAPLGCRYIGLVQACPTPHPAAE